MRGIVHGVIVPEYIQLGITTLLIREIEAFVLIVEGQNNCVVKTCFDNGLLAGILRIEPSKYKVFGVRLDRSQHLIIAGVLNGLTIFVLLVFFILSDVGPQLVFILKRQID